MSIELIYILIHMQIRECESTEKAAPFIWCGLGDSTNRVEIDAVSLFHPSGSYSPLQLALSNGPVKIYAQNCLQAPAE